MLPNNCYTGWAKPEPAEIYACMTKLPMPIFSDVCQDIKGSGKGKTILLHDAYNAVVPGGYKQRVQKNGSCVAFGASHAVDFTQVADIFIRKEYEEWIAETCTEDIYWGSRIQIGRGKLGYGEGSVGAWAARYVTEYGTLIRQKYEHHDLSVYDAELERKLSNPGGGVPQYLLEIAKEHPIKTVSNVSSYEECRDALANGYAITIASDVGFTVTRDKDGFCTPRGNWQHQMCHKQDVVIKSLHPKTIDKIIVGDVVYDHNGHLNRVTKTINYHYNGDMVRFYVTGVGYIEVTPEHPFLVITNKDKICKASEFDINDKNMHDRARWGNYHVSWVLAKDIENNDMVVCPKPSIPTDIIIPEWIETKRGKRPNPLYIDKDIAWLFGLYVADGCCVKSHKICITLGSHETKTIDRCCLAITKLGLKPYMKKYGNYVRILAYSSILANSFYQWFGKKKDKKLPEFIFHGWDLKSVLDGIHDGDGCYNHHNQKVISNVNKPLIDQVHTILIHLGHRPLIQTYDYKKSKNVKYHSFSTIYHIRWCDEIDKVQSEHTFYNDTFYVCPVRNVEIVQYDGIVYNLEVENSHSYIADWIVNHNCLIAVDDNNSRPGILILNSWPENYISGPKRLNQPQGSFWADAEVINRIVRQGDSWVFSDRIGFQPKKLDWTGFV